MCNECFERLTKELEEKGCYDFQIYDRRGTVLLIPFTYRIKSERTGKLTKKLRKSKIIGRFCPICGKEISCTN